jgi:hypothetical protein
VGHELDRDDSAEFPVVGVSFFDGNFQKARGKLHAAVNSEHDISVILRHNPENSKSPSRTAVGVYFEGLQLGHIPEVSSHLFVDRVLRRTGGSVACVARIWFGPGFNSVRLRISWPIRLRGEKSNDELPHVAGDGAFALKMKSSRKKIDWESISSTQNRVPHRFVLAIGECVTRDDGILSSGLFGRKPYFECLWGDIASFYETNVRQVQRTLNALGGQARVRYRLTRTGLTTHTLELDWVLNPLATRRASGQEPDDAFAKMYPRNLDDFSARRWPEEPK